MSNKRTCSGVLENKIEQIMELTKTDFPEPVAPAITKCGVADKSITFTAPAISYPSAIGIPSGVP